VRNSSHLETYVHERGLQQRDLQDYRRLRPHDMLIVVGLATKMVSAVVIAVINEAPYVIPPNENIGLDRPG